MKAVFFRPPLHRTLMSAVALSAVLSACTVVERPIVMRPTSERYGAPIYEQPSAVTVLDPAPVVSIYETAPLIQPAPLLVPWAPPPMLVQTPPPAPFFGAVWVGGYWSWQGQWVWSAGRWVAPPSIGYVWMQPYYEHRGNAVVFVNGFWAAPGVGFIAPPPSLRLSLAFTLGGAIGSIAIGSQGVFVPPPPGSQAGIIVPAPIGTPPAVVVSAPAVVRPGMHIVNTGNMTINNNHNTTVNNVSNVTNITNVRNVTIIAPASATTNHTAFQSTVPAHAALAAAQPAQTHWQAPLPQNTQPIPQAGASGHPSTALPMAQTVHRPSAPNHTTSLPAMQAVSSDSHARQNIDSVVNRMPPALPAVTHPTTHQTQSLGGKNIEETKQVIDYTPVVMPIHEPVMPSMPAEQSLASKQEHIAAHAAMPMRAGGTYHPNFTPTAQTVKQVPKSKSTASVSSKPAMPTPHPKAPKPATAHPADKPAAQHHQPKNKPTHD